MEQTLDFISNNGFAMVCALFFMFKGSKDTQELKLAVQELTTLIRQQKGEQNNDR